VSPGGRLLYSRSVRVTEVAVVHPAAGSIGPSEAFVTTIRSRFQAMAKSVALRLPGLREFVVERKAFREAFRFAGPGHFYSPIPSMDEVRRDAAGLFGPPPQALPGIELNEARQLELLEEITQYYRELPFPEHKSPGRRYFYENPMYSYSDAIFLYGMIRHAHPKRIVEVGSGFSSCVILDTADLFLDGKVECTFIEPYPNRLLSLLKPEDRERVLFLVKRVQDVGAEPFLALERNDILLIDSSHVAKIGSDVNYLLGEVLPRLQPGVYVHVHDIFYPFEYPEQWIRDGRWWNEAYTLRAFLAFNSAFKIILFNTFLERFHREIFERDMPLCLRNEGGSIWVQRV
jgi:predicted O-methyltransferase YrrM